MSRLTIVQILPALDAGGVERGTLEMARALVAAGHRSIVISSGGRLVAQLEREGSEHITLSVHRKSIASLFQVRPLRRFIEEIKPDIIHARSRVPAWIAWLALRKIPEATRPRFITTVHGLYSVSPYSAIMTRGDKVIAISGTVRDYIRQHYPRCPEDRIVLIHEGIDPVDFPYGYQPPAEWQAQWQADFPELTGKTVLALPGRLTRLKGHATFMQLIKTLLPSHPDIHGLIIGGAEAKKAAYAEALRDMVKREGLADHISFTGHRDDMRDVLSQCDLIFSLSTKPETFGRTVLEAILLGKPVIGWDIGGVGEILRKCYPQGITRNSNEAELLKTCAHWLEAPTKPLQTTSFPLDAMVTQTLQLYTGLARNLTNPMMNNTAIMHEKNQK